jgi:tRNA C32,U32 (ribose-2'-O)-methylase TrmJ
MDALEQLREILSNSSQTASLLSELERLNRNLESLISSDLSDESINRLEDWFENLEEMYEDVSFPDDETDEAMVKAREEMQRAYIRGVNERSLDAMTELDHALNDEVIY